MLTLEYLWWQKRHRALRKVLHEIEARAAARTTEEEPYLDELIKNIRSADKALQTILSDNNS